MLRPIWSHPECPTKEDIRDELRDLKLRFFSALPIEDADVIFMFGWGLGYSRRTIPHPRERCVAAELHALGNIHQISRDSKISPSTVSRASPTLNEIGRASCRERV